MSAPAQFPTTPIDWALMAVPIPLVPTFNREIERYLGVDASAPAAEAALPPAAPVIPAEEGPWTDEALRKFMATRLHAITIVQRVMDVLAKNPEKWMSTTELKAAIKPSVEPGSFKAAWTHLSRHIRAEYRHKTWPLKAEWGPNIGLPSEAYYQVSQSRADQWLRLRGEAQ
ncbi:MAG: hypothetical protein ACRDYF_17360 [Acidimicrobiia bacterium]